MALEPHLAVLMVYHGLCIQGTTIWDAGDQIWVGRMQAKHIIHSIISLHPMIIRSSSRGQSDSRVGRVPCTRLMKVQSLVPHPRQFSIKYIFSIPSFRRSTVLRASYMVPGIQIETSHMQGNSTFSLVPCLFFFIPLPKNQEAQMILV